MDASALLDNLLSPAILLFVVGIFAAAVRSDLEIPPPLPKGLALFLLLAIGFKGGLGLRAVQGDQVAQVLGILGVSVASSALLPLGAYALLRKRLGRVDAAAVSACYGSVSAVTFVTALAFLDNEAAVYGGYMVAALALMESPAIVTGVLLGKGGGGGGGGLKLRPLLHEALLGGPVVLLIGAMVVGSIAQPEAAEKLRKPLAGAFDVALAVFLLDMGLLAGRQMRSLKDAGWLPPTFALVAPPVQAGLGVGCAWALGLSPGDALLLAVLFGGASYIAVPAAMRIAMPEASPGLYVPMSLGITFTFNVTLGIPLYWLLIQTLW